MDPTTGRTPYCMEFTRIAKEYTAIKISPKLDQYLYLRLSFGHTGLHQV